VSCNHHVVDVLHPNVLRPEADTVSVFHEFLINSHHFLVPWLIVKGKGNVASLKFRRQFTDVLCSKHCHAVGKEQRIERSFDHNHGLGLVDALQAEPDGLQVLVSLDGDVANDPAGSRGRQRSSLCCNQSIATHDWNDQPLVGRGFDLGIDLLGPPPKVLREVKPLPLLHGNPSVPDEFHRLVVIGQIGQGLKGFKQKFPALAFEHGLFKLELLLGIGLSVMATLKTITVLLKHVLLVHERIDVFDELPQGGAIVAIVATDEESALLLVEVEPRLALGLLAVSTDGASTDSKALLLPPKALQPRGDDVDVLAVDVVAHVVRKVYTTNEDSQQQISTIRSLKVDFRPLFLAAKIIVVTARKSGIFSNGHAYIASL
jgi:hypothetical protein